MTKLQLTVIILSIVTLLFLYIGCNKKSTAQKSLEKSRSLVIELTNIDNIIQDARKELSPSDAGQLSLLEKELSKMESDSNKVNLWQRLSGLWYDLGHPAISGFYAQEIAKTTNRESSWSISGTTFAICIKNSEDQKIKEFCTNRAIESFENAISLNPGNISNRINLALSYTDNPPKDNPMKGIQMLLKLNEENPDNVPVLNNLAFLALKTGQNERALVRLEKALELEPNNKDVICLASKVYGSLGQNEKSRFYDNECKKLTN